MAASGLPDRCAWHARSVCCMALDMMDVARDLKHNGKKVQVLKIEYYGIFMLSACVGR